MTAADAGGAPAVVLIGFMGAGKSTIGRILAARLGVEFIDTDDEIVRRTGRTIPDIFATEGVGRFREIEREVVCDVLAASSGVIALGGGAVMTPAIADALAGLRVVYLQISADDGYARVAGSDRPLLAGEDPFQRYRDLLADRADTYQRVATIVVAAARGGDEVATTILDHLAADSHDADSAAERISQR
ncbi:MAG: shikimate kinase [Gordonia sp. (in: high G+C Gram-positive bacteria)]